MRPDDKKYCIYIDTGGTHSHCMLVDEKGKVARGHAATTPHDLVQCFFECIDVAAKEWGKTAAEILPQCQAIGYGTTKGTNIVVTGTGVPNLGLITTKGHEDRSLIGRLRAAGLSYAEGMHLATADKAQPLIPRARIKGVVERMDSKGEVIIPLQEDTVAQAVQELLEQGVCGIAVCLLWSFLNPAHEKRVKQIIQDISPKIAVAISSEVVPRIREYPRTMSTIIDLYVGTEVRALLDQIGSRLRQSGCKYPLLVMQASGGLARSEIVKPVSTLHSGPVGGLVGVESWKKIYGFKDAIGSDVGGTSFDVCVSSGRAEEYLREPIVGRFEISNPMREIRTMGAGGGTIAHFDNILKRIIVGPESAEAVPGPACYGKGGTNPTVTDADVAMNRIDPASFLGGRRKLSRELAITTLKEKIADPMGMDVFVAAESICKILDGQMEALLRSAMALRGLDPEVCPLFAYGGAGPTHCAGYTANLRFKKIVISPYSAAFCALGASTANVRHRYENSLLFLIPGIPYDEKTSRFTLDQLESMNRIPRQTVDRFNKTFEDLDARAMQDMLDEGFSAKEVTKRYEGEARYGGQLWELTYELPVHRIDSLSDFARLVTAFEEEFDTSYGSISKAPRGGFEMITGSIQAFAEPVKPAFGKYEYVGSDPSKAMRSKRDVFFEGRWVPTSVYDMDTLKVGNVVVGPAIIETVDTTVVIPKERKVTVDEYRNMIMEYR